MDKTSSEVWATARKYLTASEIAECLGNAFSALPQKQFSLVSGAVGAVRLSDPDISLADAAQTVAAVGTFLSEKAPVRKE